MGLARAAMRHVPGLTFWKLMGSGTGEGFTPIPNTGVYAILCAWTDADAAQHGLEAPVFARYARRAAEVCTLTLRPLTARGRWSGVSPFRPLSEGQSTGPLAALTRATVRPANLFRFWRRVPDISRRIGGNPDVRLKIGVGEVPFFHQVTFSIWPDAASMARFARTSGPHAAAIEAVRAGDWFAEELYARFAIADAQGVWQGRPAAEVLT
ncbi:spheroidene monooxygenase [Jannaschia seohaensis]|uniref:Spheroidene monooxygenase n=2 Tax=Jannaschia seohaensis TaxID=475081 RepID=A0A2Y9A5W0_9RHOB|nr:spheroidene monooxygenase [Jannaschia seohaensis]SSA37969.1 spheroidene monooxygenase [Jannaschia seohaensis]